jgi:hypothetical protein
MPLNSRKVCRCYPWNTAHLTDSSRLSSWLRFLDISGRSSQTLVFIIRPAQFMPPHYNLIMTHSTQCHYCTPHPHPRPHLLAAHGRANRSMSTRVSRSQRPCGLTRGLAASRLLGLRVRIPPGAWMFFSGKRFVLSGRGLCVGLITSPEESYRLWSV